MRIPTHEEARGARDVLALQELREALAEAMPGAWYRLEPPWLSDQMPTSVLAGSPDPHAGLYVCHMAGDDDDPDAPEWDSYATALAIASAVNFIRSAELAGLIAIAEALAPVLRAAFAEGNAPPPHVAAALDWVEGR